MSRTLKKSWANRQDAQHGAKREGWTRRIRWYEDDLSVRLNFEDMSWGIFNKIYKLPDQLQEATEDWDKFKRGEAVVRR